MTGTSDVERVRLAEINPAVGFKRSQTARGWTPAMSALGIFLLSALALASNGYHLGSDDGAIYVPGIKLAADPSLYHAGSAFFLPHATFTIFPQLIGLPAHLLKIPVDWAIFIWYTISLILLFTSVWYLLGACFRQERARWAGLFTIAVALATPVAGTAVILVDPYLTSRSLSTPATLFALAAYARNRKLAATLWLVIATAIHPQMGVYAIAAVGFMALSRFQLEGAIPLRLASAIAPVALLDFKPAHGVYREILASRPYFLISNWHWYEWIGVVAPLVLLWVFSRTHCTKVKPAFQLCSRSLVWFGVTFTAVAIVIASFPQLESFERFQPMRCLHLVYLVILMFAGALLGQYVLRKSIWRWAVCFVPILASMWTVQAREFPNSPHIEIPGFTYSYGWVPALLWIRGNTPKDALFALDPDYFTSPGNDLHGFRAIAERSALADELKDSGAVAVFPQLGNEWEREVAVQKLWRTSNYRNFGTLVKGYGVKWFIFPRRFAVPGLTCPYQNHDFRVCTIAPPAA